MKIADDALVQVGHRCVRGKDQLSNFTLPLSIPAISYLKIIPISISIKTFATMRR